MLAYFHYIKNSVKLIVFLKSRFVVFYIPLYSYIYIFLTLTRRSILDTSKLNEFADDNFKFHENGRKLSKRVENTVGKGEIARYEQFLLFPQCFQKTCFLGASKGVIVWEWVKQQIRHPTAFSNIVDEDQTVHASL